MWRELKIANVFTMEASFCGADKGEFKDCHFTTENLMNAGQTILEALLVYCNIDVAAKYKLSKPSGIVPKESSVPKPDMLQY
jgi:hypothetical protein